MSEREEQILLLLQRFDFLTRDQLRRCLDLGTVRNTNRILNGISEYLHCMKDGHTSIYYLSREGRLYVGCEKIRKKGAHVDHTIMRNELWLYMGRPADWENEIAVSNGKVSVVSDATFSKDGFKCIVEVDHLQAMTENRLKVKKYKELMSSLALQLGYYPTIIWLTTTELRKRQLELACEGLKAKIFTIKDIQ